MLKDVYEITEPESGEYSGPPGDSLETLRLTSVDKTLDSSFSKEFSDL